MKKSRSCNTCSYFISDIDISNLSQKQQEDFATITSDDLDTGTEAQKQYRLKLITDTVSNYCVGGLIEDGQLKEKCSMYVDSLPDDFSNSERLSSFHTRKTTRFDIWKFVIGTAITVVTFLATFFILNVKIRNLESENVKLQNAIKLKQSRISADSLKSLNDQILLNDSIRNLNIKIKTLSK